MVFILLIFFVVTASFIRESTLPLQSQHAGLSADITENNTLDIVIDSENRIFLNRQAVSAEAIRARIVKQVQQKGAEAETAALISPSASSGAGTLVTVIDQLRLAGIENIRVREQEGQ